jgi:hypothetical protein
MRSNNKYNAKRVKIDNIWFASMHEGKRYQELMLLQRAGQIQDLQLQVPFVITVNGKKICKYLADFQYIDTSTGKTVIEDAKGYRNNLYVLKKKLVEAQYEIKIVEV